jgi:hypothetical protein
VQIPNGKKLVSILTQKYIPIIGGTGPIYRIWLKNNEIDILKNMGFKVVEENTTLTVNITSPVLAAEENPNIFNKEETTRIKEIEKNIKEEILEKKNPKEEITEVTKEATEETGGEVPKEGVSGIEISEDEVSEDATEVIIGESAETEESSEEIDEDESYTEEEITKLTKQECLEILEFWGIKVDSTMKLKELKELIRETQKREKENDSL